MTVLAVAFDGTRVNDSTANTNWDNFPTGGQAPASEANNFYQGGSVVNQKLSTQTLDGIDYDHSATASYDMATPTVDEGPLFFAKLYVTDYGAIDSTFGALVGIGSALADHYKYNVAGSGALIDRFLTYPARGGYLIAAINPNVSGWRDSAAGTPALGAVDWWGAQADWVAAASAKSENFAFDAIDVGSGLSITLGTGADPAGTFPDFVAADQDQVTTGRWGVVFGAGVFVEAQGMLTIGSATATEFDDSTSQVVFLDSYCGEGDFGVTCDIQNASTIINIGCSITGLGSNHTEADTRPDHIVTGTSGSYDFSGTLANHRNVTFTSVCDIVDASIACVLLTQASANISDSVIITDSLTNVACLQDPTFGSTADLNDTTFVQAGAGHALEVLATGSHTGIKYVGYGGTPGSNLTPASGAADAAVFNDTGTAITITVVGGGDTPSVRNGAGATTTVVAAVAVTLDNVKDDTEFRVYNQDNPPVELDGIEAATDGTVDDRSFTFSLAAGTIVDIAVFNVDWVLPPNNRIDGFEVPTTDTTIPLSQVFDRNFNNP